MIRAILIKRRMKMIELREPKYNVGDKVVDNQGVVYEILRLEEYSFVHNDYVYLLNDEYDAEFERYLEPYTEKENENGNQRTEI